jgi:hypothetical protein
LKQGIEEGAIRPSIDPTFVSVDFNAFVFGLMCQWLVSPNSVDLHSVFYCYRRSTLETSAERRV